MGDHSSHQRKKLDELFGVLALSDRKVVRKGLKRGKFDVKFLELQGALENTAQLLLVFHKMVKNVAEKTIKNEESRVNLSLLVTLDESEEKIKKVLPDGLVLLLDHSALNFDSHIADFMHVRFVGSVCAMECLKNHLFDLATSTVT